MEFTHIHSHQEEKAQEQSLDMEADWEAGASWARELVSPEPLRKEASSPLEDPMQSMWLPIHTSVLPWTKRPLGSKVLAHL